LLAVSSTVLITIGLMILYYAWALIGVSCLCAENVPCNCENPAAIPAVVVGMSFIGAGVALLFWNRKKQHKEEIRY
jgi:nitrate reductase gamma subunit